MQFCTDGRSSATSRSFRTVPETALCFAIYIHSNEIHNIVALIKCLLILRCQLYMFRNVTVHPQELLCRYCICRIWYVLIRPAGATFKFFLKRCTSWTYQVVRLLPRTIVCTYSIYKEAPEDGPLQSETCRADTSVLNKQSVQLHCVSRWTVYIYIYCKK